MSKETYISLTELVDELRQICSEQKSGVMYITSSANRSAQIMIDKGKIVFIYYFNKRGRDALALMPQIERGKYRFQEGTAPALKADLPETDEILHLLSTSGDVASDDTEPIQLERSEAEVSIEEDINSSLTEKQKRILEEGLAVFIGPMAMIICEDHLRKTVDVKTAVELLAGEIPTESQAESFREEMQRKILS